MGGRFGKYGDAKRKAQVRQKMASGHLILFSGESTKGFRKSSVPPGVQKGGS
ncbi:MAG: hypothetical protein KAU60_05490 [Desulfobacterales bacterium]|nr:hypothetical protein [Desulfobacterales bacterium]